MGRLIIDGVEDSEDYYAGSSLFRVFRRYR